MKFEYKDYVLDIEEMTDYDTGNLSHYRASCEQLPGYPSGIFKVDLDVLIRYFQQRVDMQIASDVKKTEKEKALDNLVNPKLQLSFLTDKGKTITLPCHIREDGCVECEPFTEENTIVGWANQQTKENMKITSTYRGYPVEIKLDGDKLYSCTIKTRYGVEDKEIFVKPIDYILYHQQGIVDSYKSFGEIAPNERVYHILEIEYKNFILKSYYNYNTNQTFFSSISKEKKDIKKEELSFTPTTNTQELIDQFITFVDSKEEVNKNEDPTLTEFNNAVESLRRSSCTKTAGGLVNSLYDIYSLYGSVLGFSLEDVKSKYFGR